MNHLLALSHCPFNSTYLNMKFFYTLCFFLISLLGFSQTQPDYPKKTHVDSLGRYYQQASLPVYIMIATSPDGKTIPLQPTAKKEIYLEGHGPHALKHQNNTTGKEDEFMIYADGLAPITSSSFLNAPIYNSSKVFYGPGLSVTLAAKDEMSGVEDVYHSVNGDGYTKYKSISFAKEGSYTYNYYAVDKTGNTEKANTKSFTVDLTAPITYHHIISISSENIISTTSSIYLTTSDSLSGVSKTFYKFDKEPYKTYVGGNIAFQSLLDGEHTLTYYSIDHVTNKEVEQSFKFYLDKTAPIMSADVLGDKFLVGEKVYFSGRTKLKLTAVDNKSGIKKILYSINSEPFGQYTEPFYLPGKSGYHTVKFYAVDNTSNTANDDFSHTVGVVYVDLTGPTISQGFVGPTFIRADTVFISPKTRLSILATDPEAGLKNITYILNGQGEEKTYNSSQQIDMSAASGFQSFDYFGYDNVNNKNSRHSFFIVDNKGPEIGYQFSVAAASGKVPSYTSIFLSGTDAQVGADQIRYTINGGKEQPYISPIKGFVKDKKYVIKIFANDLLGNTSTEEINFMTDRY